MVRRRVGRPTFPSGFERKSPPLLTMFAGPTLIVPLLEILPAAKLDGPGMPVRNGDRPNKRRHFLPRSRSAR